MAEPIEANDKEVSDTEKKRREILPIILDVLKYLLLTLALAAFIIIITVITVRTLQSQNKIQNTDNRVSIDIQQSVPEDLDWYNTLGEIRGSLLDESQVSYIVDIYIGYQPTNQAVLQELTRRNVQIKERVALYFSSQYQSDVQGARNLIRMKNELREIINRMMNNKIREVAFNNIQIIPF